MKKLFYALGAMMLLGLFSACVDPVNNVDNPNYDPVKDVITTQFVINIAPVGEDAKTKQTGSAVQIDRVFRGLGNATLFPMHLSTDGKKVLSISDGQTATTYIPITTMLGPGTIGQGGQKESQRVMELSIPRETNTILFYGEAITGTTADEYNDLGGLEYTMDGTRLDRIGCNAMRRLHPDSVAFTDFQRMENIMLTVLNTLFKVGINYEMSTAPLWENLQYKRAGSGTVPASIGSYDFTIAGHGKAVHWSDYADCWQSNAVSPLPRVINNDTQTAAQKPVAPFEQILGLTYHAFTTLNEVVVGTTTDPQDPTNTTNQTVKELRAGSGAAIYRQMRDLYSVVSSALLSEPMSDEEMVAMYVIKEIQTYIGLFFTPDAQGKLQEWKNLRGTTESIWAGLDTIGKKGTLALPSKDIYTAQDFPFHFNLPMGAVTLLSAGTSTEIFKYNTNNISLVDMGGGSMSVGDYTYPPSLVYFGNSPIRTNNSETVDRSKFPDGVSNWEKDNVWTSLDAGWVNNSHVTIETRAVAMTNNVQYGNAMLETTVQFSDEAYNNGLKDNNLRINQEPNKVIWLGGGNGTVGSDATKTLELTGILIGGQPNHVGWNYLPTAQTYPTSVALAFNRMVYDKRLNGGVEEQDGGVYLYPVAVPISKAKTPSNYTLLFDNYDSTLGDNAQKEVYVALEFRNKLGSDFWGNANLIRDGGTFYIMGKLEITQAMRDAFADTENSGASDKWKHAGVIMPPYETTGTDIGKTKKILRVFMQEFITKANFVIGENALQLAYVTVPDLRTAKMSFGLSVDLQWENGLDFGNIVLGQ